MSRGLRNNNPGNIRLDGMRWLGEVLPSADAAFKQFASRAWGYRAMFVLLETYRRRYGLQTLREMIARYAPPSENDTGGYLQTVARLSGVDPDAALDMADGMRMQAVAAAMSLVENGVNAVTDEVAAGWRLFLKHRK